MTEAPAAPDATGGYLDALAVGEFRALFAAYTVSMLGDIVAAVALTVLVFQRTGSPFLAGVTFTLAFRPTCSAAHCSRASSTACPRAA